MTMLKQFKECYLRIVVDYAVVEDIFLGWDLGAVGARLLEENGLAVNKSQGTINIQDALDFI